MHERGRFDPAPLQEFRPLLVRARVQYCQF